MQTNFLKLFNLALLSIVLISCKTSRDLVKAEPEHDDPAQVKTIDNPVVSSGASGESLDETKRELAISQGELETVRVQSQKEKEELNRRLALLEEEKLKLIEENTKLKGLVKAEVVPEKRSASSLWDQARAQLREGKAKEAIPLLEDFIKSYSKDKNGYFAHLLLGMAHYRLADYRSSAIVFDQAIDRFPKRKDISMAWFSQGVCFIAMKQFEDAKLFFDEVQKLNPRSLEAHESRKLRKKPKVPSDLFAVFSLFTSSVLNEANASKSHFRN